MRTIKELVLTFPWGASVKEAQEIAEKAEDILMAGVSEGGMMVTSKYGLNVDNVTFSEDTMHFIYGHNRLQDNSK